ncbi:MAG TPA: GNAT family N-acetyltransferase, partial [Planctomycetota bacterium]|nr:GNAT family N-acetyltransferase [Planctomycetota bacterium]
MRALLAAAGLPADDVSEAGLEGFVVAVRGERIVGAAGLELHGDAGLLRSVAVAGDERGAGLGSALVARHRDRAQQSRVAVQLEAGRADDPLAADG